MSTLSPERSPADETVPANAAVVPGEEQRFLEGPQSRLRELWRAIRIFFELMHGLRKLHFVGPCVTVFGSARFPETHPYYGLARQVGTALAREGFTVMTGGGPGIMEAANRGAREARGHSVGCNIVLPMEQQPNPYLDQFVEFRYFFVRKLMLVKFSYAFVVMPGGFGTMDELFEIATLIQTGKVERFPVVLAGSDYWRPLVQYMRATMVESGTIGPEDVDRLIVSDDPKFIAKLIADVASTHFGLTKGKPLKPRWWLLETTGYRRRKTGNGTTRGNGPPSTGDIRVPPPPPSGKSG
jgi:uncharacterized protein (TIGR00730 family)